MAMGTLCFFSSLSDIAFLWVTTPLSNIAQER